MTMKEVNSYGWKAVIGSSIGYAMDGFDLLILGCCNWWFYLWYLVR
ncbi:hypothetical protein [Veillonella parvula]|nr:hypothetical protein [Veillonella parvula]MDU3190499.1 hypothetical protein [Veillonella parvula]